MRRIALASLVMGLLVFAAAASAQPEVAEPAKATVGVQYAWSGPMGTLSIANATGLPFAAWAINGAPVAQGVVPGPMMSMQVPNCGQRADGVVLIVTVGESTFMVSDEDWIWD